METAKEFLDVPSKPARLTKRKFKWIAIAGLLVLVAISAGIARYWNTTVQAARFEQERNLGATALADRFGVQVTLIGISETSGFIELRYTVLDPDKALDINHYIENYPKLIAEKNGAVLLAPQVLHHEHHLEAGRSYYFFINNQHGTLSPGDLVTVEFGDVQVKHLSAQ